VPLLIIIWFKSIFAQSFGVQYSLVSTVYLVVWLFIESSKFKTGENVLLTSIKLLIANLQFNLPGFVINLRITLSSLLILGNA